MTDSKIINDPVFGFIKVPKGLLLNLVKHPSMQRLRRIKQLGLASMVYPGAQHTRFQHSLGAFHLMREAILSLTQKGVYIFDMEAEAISAAILMHDIGHGPFSHVLENTLIRGISHEDISLLIMERLNEEMNGGLTLAIRIFQNQYPKQFLHQLISSQLDVDRLDYLRRDSFFTGVSEGNIGSARIIKMLDVVDDNLVIEQKGIYSIENYLIARRLMYWQVYLHKTTVACESVLVNTLLRAKHLARSGVSLFASPSLHYFLYNDVDRAFFERQSDSLRQFELLDDNDIISAIKQYNATGKEGQHGFGRFSPKAVLFDMDATEEIFGFGTEDNFGDAVLFTDERINGQSHTILFDFWNQHLIGKIYVEVYTLSRDLYLYEKSLKAASQLDEFSIIFAEPVQLYCNVTGGIGILGGSAVSKIPID